MVVPRPRSTRLASPVRYSVPQGNSRSSSPRAARSHSVSVGSRRPGSPIRSPSQRQYATARSWPTPVTGWSAGASDGVTPPVSRANSRHWPTVTGVRAIRKAGTRTRVRGASFRYQSSGTPVSA